MTRPQAFYERRTCRHRYHDGVGADPTLTCACGIFAIGKCRECGTPVCGHHGHLRDEELLCAVDVAARDDEAARVQRDAKSQDLAASWTPRIENFRDDLALIDDPIERFICAVTARHQQRAWYGGHLEQTLVEYRALDSTAAKELAAAFEATLRVLSSLCAQGLDSTFSVTPADPGKWTWTPASVGRWARARSALPRVITFYTPGNGGRWGDKGQKKRNLSGMLLESGHQHPDQSDSRSPGWSYDEYLLDDGTVIRVDRGKTKANRWNQPRPLDRAQDLVLLARLLRLRVPEPRARRR